MTYRKLDPNKAETSSNAKYFVRNVSTKELIKKTILLVALGALASIVFVDWAESSEPISQVDPYESLNIPSADLEGLACKKPTAKFIERTEPLGPLYNIAEPNLLELFLGRIKAMQADGDYDKRFEENKSLIGNLLENPPAVQGLEKSFEERTWLLTASIPESLPDELIRQAEQVELPRISRELLFIDGADELSIEAARILASRFPDMRVVLTAGSPAEVSDALNRRIFFDQGGGLVRVFGIKAVPAILFNSANGPAGLEFPAVETESVLQKYFPTSIRTALPDSHQPNMEPAK